MVKEVVGSGGVTSTSFSTSRDGFLMQNNDNNTNNAINDKTDSQVEEGTGMSKDNPLLTVAVPGLITLLDISLYNTYENELVASTSCSHNLLATWIDIKHQSINILSTLHKYSNTTVTTTTAIDYNNYYVNTIGRDNIIESFVKRCLHLSCDAIENLIADQLSSLSSVYNNNLNNNSDPLKKSISSNGIFSNGTTTAAVAAGITTGTVSTSTGADEYNYAISGGNNTNRDNSTSNYYNKYSSNNNNNNSDIALATAIRESAYDTGRRSLIFGSSTRINNIQHQQQCTKDSCLESSTIYCPDYTNFVDSVTYSQRLLHKLLHHPLITTCLTKSGYYTTTGSSTTASTTASAGSTVNNNNTSSSIGNICTTGGVNGANYHQQQQQQQNYYTSNGSTTSNSIVSNVLSTIPNIIENIISCIVPIILPSELEFSINTLLQLLCIDLSNRIIQFRNSIESNSNILQHLYLLKLQYRIPYNLFIESHIQYQKVPSLQLIDEYNKIITVSSTSTTTTTTTASSQIQNQNQQLPQLQQQQQQQQQQQLLDDKVLDAKNQLQNLVQTPEFINALVLEQQIEQMEINISKQLLPFCDFARYIEYKRARLVSPIIIPTSTPPVLLSEEDDTFFTDTTDNATNSIGPVQQTLSRLRTVLCRTSNNSVSNNNASSISGKGSTSNIHNSNYYNNESTIAESSKGIRPLLLDLQGIPRLVEIRSQQQYRYNNNVETRTNENEWNIQFEQRLHELIHHLHIIGKLCTIRGAFRIERRIGTDGSGGVGASNSAVNANNGATAAATTTVDYLDKIPLIIERGCTEEFDSELFYCHVHDWFDLVQKQRILVSNGVTVSSSSSSSSSLPTTKKVISFESLSKLIGKAEMNVNVASTIATQPGLIDTISNRTIQLSNERTKRFDVLKDIIETIAQHEMNLYIQLQSPDPYKVLQIKSSLSTCGFFGIPLQMAGELKTTTQYQ